MRSIDLDTLNQNEREAILIFVFPSRDRNYTYSFYVTFGAEGKVTRVTEPMMW